MAQATYISPADTAKLVRKSLKTSFPGIKFSVRTSTYAGGASIDVRWTDGPTTEQVDRVVKRFAGASFDGMIDLKSYHYDELDGELVHFGADFIFTERGYSVGFLTRRTQQVCKRWGIPMPEIKPDGARGAYVESHGYGPTGYGLVEQSGLFITDMVYRECQQIAVGPVADIG